MTLAVVMGRKRSTDGEYVQVAPLKVGERISMRKFC
jgi:hypothetical protein